MSNKEKLFLWVALIFGAALFVGAIVEGVKHSGKHGTTYPTRTEFNAVVNQHKQWQEKRDSQLCKILQKQDSEFVRITTMMQQIISIQKRDQQYEAVQDDFILDLRAELDRIKSEQKSK